MRSCPLCETVYADEVENCEHDGRALRPADAASATASAPSAGVAGEMPTWPSFAAFPASPAAAAAAAPASTTAPGAPLETTAVRTTFSPGATSSGSFPAPRAAGDDLHSSASAGQVAKPAPATSSSEVFDSLVGATLAGRYLIVRRIGEGGMGAVYEARHTIIGKRVAVKVLLEKFLTKSDFVARLLQEARLASAIGHEHIVDVTDFGTTDDGRAFVAMEFLEGESLAQLVMREAPLPVERSLRITRQVASALGAAHAKGIVHRDVKPENVYLIRRGEADFVKVVDFGISKAVKQGQGDDTPDYHLTHTGLLLGTPLYMSPEQARGDEDLDHRVDVWAMGVMLYECLTGEVPFRANNYLGIISQVLTHTALPPSKLRPELGIPEAVEAVVMRAMEKDRSRRYALMAEVEQDLERLLAGDQNVGAGVKAISATVPPLPSSAGGRIWVWSAAVAALIAGVVMVLARPEAAADAPPTGQARIEVGRPAATSSSTGRPAPLIAPATGQVPVDPAKPPVRDRAVGAALPAPAPPRDSLSPSARHSKGAGKRGVFRASSLLQQNRTDAAAGGDRLPGSAAPATRKFVKSDDPVIRGVLPSRSGEGYPDN